jgi:ribonuclease P protein component
LKEFGLSADERIKSRKDFEELFSKGITLISSTKKIRAVYLINQHSDEPGIKIAVAVSRRSGKANWRNRVKRLIRESYRLNKIIFVNKARSIDLFIRIVFSPYSINMRNSKKIYLADLMPDIKEIMSRISSSV